MRWPFKKPKTIGTLRIDRSDPDDAPYLFLELEVDPSVLEHEQCITLRVNTQSYIPQK